VIRIPDNIHNKVSFLVGNPDQVADTPTTVFDESRLDFLADLSEILLKKTGIRDFPDVVTFAFWCRKGNLIKVSTNASNNKLRLGLGMVFHISPSNVPINFAFSLVFAFLAGNSCVVRLPSKDSDSASEVIGALSNLLESQKYLHFIPFINLIKFEYNDEVNKFWLSVADARVIWGGDKTVAYMRSLESKPRSREIAFPDRYSICALNPTKVLKSSSSDLNTLCANLFNDIYLMDQNACSSPQLLVWVGGNSDIEHAKAKFWPMFLNYVEKKYTIEPIHVMDKYVGVCRNILVNDNIMKVKRHKNLVYNVELKKLQNQQQQQRGYFGTIHEISLGALNDIVEIVDNRYQTLAYYGFDKKILHEFVVSNNLQGIDRIIPIGRALEMDIIWDGYDVVEHLSRVVNIQ
jgi:hypothetical protein